MGYKYLGNTDLRLPVIGIGTYRYKGGADVLKRALQLGVCFIDTAEGYGTEEVIGDAIGGRRDQVIISTKVWPTHFKYKDVIEACENSLRRLKTDYIDLYQLHWPNPTIPISETMGAMESLVDAGKIRFIGVSNFLLRQLKQAIAAMTKYKILFNQVSYNLVNRHIEHDLMPYCIANDIMIIAYSPLNKSLECIRAQDRQRALSKIAGQIEKTRAQVALNWCISKKDVIAIPKSDSLEHIAEDLGAAGWRLLPEQIELLESSIKSPQGPVEFMLRRKARRFLELTGIRKPMYKKEIEYR